MLTSLQNKRAIQQMIMGLLCVNMAVSISPCVRLCSCTNNRTYVRCNNQDLELVPSLLPSSVVHLNLADNKIQTLWNGSFTHTAHVEMIDLQRNSMEVIKEMAFAELVDLQVLKLGKNKLSHLPKNVFLQNTKLILLDLHGNSFASVPHQVMFPLASLQVLNMSYNQLTSALLGEGFQHTKSLVSLDLSGNPLGVIDSYVFQASLWWELSYTHSLNLSHCQIKRLNREAFTKLYRLDSLSLSGNIGIDQGQLQNALADLHTSRLRLLDMSYMNLSDIYNIFYKFHHQQLEKLKLDHNCINSILPKTFYFLNNLKQLDISHNHLRSIGELGMNQLQSLSMANNQISKVNENDFDGLPKLQVLDLSNNLIQTISDTPFQKLFYIEEVNLSGNSISKFSVSTGLEHLQILRIGKNSLEDLTFLQKLPRLLISDISENHIKSLNSSTCLPGQSFKFLNFSHNDITYISDDAFKSCPLESVDFSHNALISLHVRKWIGLKNLHVHHNNLSKIRFTSVQNVETLEYVDLSYNMISEIPGEIFNHTVWLKHLDLSGNPLEQFLSTREAKSIMINFKSLTHLSLSGISLSNINPGIFSKLFHLVSLDLSWNNLTTIHAIAFWGLLSLETLDLSHNAITEPNKEMLAMLVNLQWLDLSHNPYHCTCQLMEFKNWAEARKSVMQNLQCKECYMCVAPTEWRGTSLMDFTLESFSCTHQEKVVILAVISCALLAILLTVGVTIYKNRGWVRKHLQRAHYRTMYDSFTLVNPNRHEPV